MQFLVQHDPRRAFVIRPPEDAQYPCIILKFNNWNDYSYYTACDVFVYQSQSSPRIAVGPMKIMYRGQKEGDWVFHDGPNSFNKLNSSFCSLSSELNFYKKLNEISREFAVSFLTAMNDAVYSSRIWNDFESESCFKVSLLRDRLDLVEVRDAVQKMFRSRQRRISSFIYTVQLPGAVNEHKISFDFRRQTIPYRLNLLVGPNGAGKTQLLAKMAIALSGITAEDALDAAEQIVVDKKIHAGTVTPTPSFYGVIAISFNAFDKFEVPIPPTNSVLSYTYCGIRKEDGTLCSENDLVQRIQNAIEGMDDKQRKILMQSFDNVLGLTDAHAFFSSDAASRYEKLSAGQRIILNILTHLIAKLRDRSLVLLDEPETHLHPSLMTTLVSELLRILKLFNSYAIIATHSPIIAQQVPSRSIRIIARVGDFVEVTKPDIECFGENLSEISNVLFETREYERDYTDIIDKLMKANNYRPESVEALFPNGIGSNARIYLWAQARGRD